MYAPLPTPFFTCSRRVWTPLFSVVVAVVVVEVCMCLLPASRILLTWYHGQVLSLLTSPQFLYPVLGVSLFSGGAFVAKKKKKSIDTTYPCVCMYGIYLLQIIDRWPV